MCATPVVINFTDDNGDGITNNDDIPDVAFLTYDREGDGCCNTEATIRIHSGACDAGGGMVHLADIDEDDIDAFNGSGYYLNNDTGMAGADLDGDGVAELVAITKKNTSNNNVQGTVAF